jgi:tetratricopeptide (TPR) repeat protein
MPEKQWQLRIRRVEDNEQEHLQYVRSLMREQRLDEAREELLAILEQNDKSYSARILYGSLLQRQGAYAEALDQFEYAIGIDPMETQAHLRAGVCCLRMNDIEQARSLLGTALELDPKHASAHLAMASVLSATGETEGAISHLEEVLRLDPQMAPARILKARLLKQSGNISEAIEELGSFVKANPDHVGATVRLARLYEEQGDTEKATELLEAATKIRSDVGMVWALLGRLKLRVNDYAGAEKAFREAVRLRPRNFFNSLGLIRALTPQRKFDEARKLLRRLPRQGDFASIVHQCYGDIYAAQDMHDEAVQSYRAALLQGQGSDQMVKEIDSENFSDGVARVAYYQAAIAKLRENARKTRGQGDWGFRLQGWRKRMAQGSLGTLSEGTVSGV